MLDLGCLGPLACCMGYIPESFKTSMIHSSAGESKKEENVACPLDTFPRAFTVVLPMSPVSLTRSSISLTDKPDDLERALIRMPVPRPTSSSVHAGKTLAHNKMSYDRQLFTGHKREQLRNKSCHIQRSGCLFYDLAYPAELPEACHCDQLA